MLSVGLLGVFRISNADIRCWSELGSAGRSFASYLFTYLDRPHRRERLADLFWPGLDADRARSALNSAVWRFRKILATEAPSGGAQTLKTEGGDIVLERAEWLDIDAHALEKASAFANKNPQVLADEAILDRVMAALSRYSGPFLDGDDDDWILEERENLHSIFVRTTIQAVHQLGMQRRYSDAIELACRGLKFDPFREELVRMFLGCLTLNEQRAQAIHHFESWTRSLARELAIAPLPATRTIIEEIRIIDTAEDLQAFRLRLFGLRA